MRSFNYAKGNNIIVISASKKDRGEWDIPCSLRTVAKMACAQGEYVLIYFSS